MIMDKSYQPQRIEQHWYAFWEKEGCFSPLGEGRDSYCIMLPPPNVTGRLHMGHAFQDTIMDALIRYQRMRGNATLWQGGTDHAGIATQMVVERQLLGQGTSRHDLGREDFVEKIWEWKQRSGGFINRQLRLMGASLDWRNERFTMDEGMSAAVRKVFVSLYDEGLIYRGKRLVNWDPVLNTALSDLEVVNQEQAGQLWHINYPRVDGKGFVTVATTRPETLLGDAAVAVHPEDERYQDLVGLSVNLPLTKRSIPVIADEYVDREFGSGCVKITPAHDFNDYEVGQRHRLPMHTVIDLSGHLNDAVPEAYRGMERFAARKRVVADLEQVGLLAQVESHNHSVPVGDRSGAVLEPLLTDQWFVRVAPLAEPAIKAVQDGRIRFVPENWSKTYFEWMHNIRDWCISRQLWWGHRIPAWYDDDGNIYVADDEAAARRKHDLAEDLPLHQDPDVLDTWFSSALWPFSTLGWPESTPRLRQFYPTSVLVTGFDIIFFWVARMIMMGLKFMGEVPFRDVYIHGLIRDGHGQKMSKSKGNVLDPVDLIQGIDLESLVSKRTQGLMQPQMAPRIEADTRRDFPDGIQAYGTDPLRFTFASLATYGRDITFDIGRIEGYRNFCNKLWNAARFVLGNSEGFVRSDAVQPDFSVADQWIRQSFATLAETMSTQFNAYRFDLAAQAIYDFIWHEYCDWYLELTKPVLQGESSSEEQRYAATVTLLTVLEGALRLLHPIMPFISEEIWQRTAPLLDINGASISLQSWPQPTPRGDYDAAVQDVEWIKSVILAVRRIRGEMNIAPGKSLHVHLRRGNAGDRARSKTHALYIRGLARVEDIRWREDDADSTDCAVGLAGDLEILVPLKGLVDPQAEIARLGKQLAKVEKQVQISQGKLANERFVANAPQCVVDEEKTRADAAARDREKLLQQVDVLKNLL